MPRYYFDIFDNEGFHRDDFGHELEDYEEACQQAQAIVPHIMQEELPNGELHTVACDMREETGRIVYHAELKYKGIRFPPLQSPDK